MKHNAPDFLIALKEGMDDIYRDFYEDKNDPELLKVLEMHNKTIEDYENDIITLHDAIDELNF
jgi:hypothetical protein